MSGNHVRIPSYRRHRASGQAVVTLPDGLGGRRDILLGRFGTATSKNEYKRVVLDWEANGRRLPNTEAVDLTISELIAKYWQYVESYYRHPDGTPTGEVVSMKYTLRPLAYLHGNMIAKDFGPSSLKAVRELMIHGYEHPRYGPQKPGCRTHINAKVKRIRRSMQRLIHVGTS